MCKKSCEYRVYKKGKVNILVQDGFLVEKDKKGKIFPMSPTKIDAIAAELGVTDPRNDPCSFRNEVAILNILGLKNM